MVKAPSLCSHWGGVEFNGDTVMESTLNARKLISDQPKSGAFGRPRKRSTGEKIALSRVFGT